MRTWSNIVDCYIALTEFSRRKLIDGGLPAAKIRVKPNFVLPDPGMREKRGQYALFAGRLVDPKGLPTMLAAWKQLSQRIPLMIIGDGPNRESLEAQLKDPAMRDIVYRGRLSHNAAIDAIKDSRFLVFPSEWYEGFPVTIAEAFACGVPVICSRLGSMQESVADGRTRCISGRPKRPIWRARLSGHGTIRNRWKPWVEERGSSLRQSTPRNAIFIF